MQSPSTHTTLIGPSMTTITVYYKMVKGTLNNMQKARAHYSLLLFPYTQVNDRVPFPYMSQYAVIADSITGQIAEIRVTKHFTDKR